MNHFQEIRTCYLSLCKRSNAGRIYTILGIYIGKIALFLYINSYWQYKFVRILVFHKGLDNLFGFPEGDTCPPLTFISYNGHV